MSLEQPQRDAAIRTLQMMRSKILDTEKLILLDQLEAHHVLVRASELEGQAQVLAISVLTDHSSRS